MSKCDNITNPFPPVRCPQHSHSYSHSYPELTTPVSVVCQLGKTETWYSAANGRYSFHFMILSSFCVQILRWSLTCTLQYPPPPHSLPIPPSILLQCMYACLLGYAVLGRYAFFYHNSIVSIRYWWGMDKAWCKAWTVGCVHAECHCALYGSEVVSTYVWLCVCMLYCAWFGLVCDVM
jgi:hypothetical protein